MDSKKYILLTIDVEDWFQVENFRPWIPFETWDQRELRVEHNTHRLLDLFDSFEVVHRAGSMTHGVEGTANKTEELEGFRRRRIGVSQFHPGTEKKKYPKNPVNPVGQNKNKIQATFFVLGWLADKLPNLVREIQSRGHEIASHGDNHNLCDRQSPAALKKELTDCKKKLEDIIGSQVFGYRAPNFSVNNDILNLVEDCGYRYDSSYNSFALHGRYGEVSLNGSSKKGLAHQMSADFFELPISNIYFRRPLSYVYPVKFFRRKTSEDNLTGELRATSSKRNDVNRFVLPWGGGAYFRLMPFPIFKQGIKKILSKESAYLFYVHPWELDPEQPEVVEANSFNKFKHYTNIRKSGDKLKKLIKSFNNCKFTTCSEYLKSLRQD